MDHLRSCGLAALAALVLTTNAISASTNEPPVSGVGDARVAPRVESTQTTSTDAGDARLDPAELAERIAARIAAADASRRATSVTESPAETSIEPASRATTDAESADVADVLPAPRPSGSRFIDRFAVEDPADSSVGADVGGGFASADDWWALPEVRVGALLAVFIGVAVVARRWSNTRGPRAGRPSGVLSVLARYPFGRGASLVLLEVGPRMVLVHQQGGRGGEVRPIAEFTTPEEISELRTRLGIARRESEPGFGRDLERNLGLYDRKGRPQGFGGPDGLPLDDVMETVDLTRRRPRRGNRTI
jgi:flagellar biogenesis protein FliO